MVALSGRSGCGRMSGQCRGNPNDKVRSNGRTLFVGRERSSGSVGNIALQFVSLDFRETWNPGRPTVVAMHSVPAGDLEAWIAAKVVDSGDVGSRARSGK